MTKSETSVFFSYAAESGSEELTDELERRLRTLGRPWFKFRAVKVVRDSSALAASEELWPTIAENIDNCEHFLLVASPAAAGSRWVDREIVQFVSSRTQHDDPRRLLLIAVVAGSVVWSEETGDFDWSRTDAVPRSVSGAFTSEPLFVDLSHHTTPDRRGADREAFDRDVAALSAGFRGLNRDEVLDLDRRARRRLAFAAISSFGFVVALALVFGVFAMRARSEEQELSMQIDARADASNIIEQESARVDRFRDKRIDQLELHVSVDSIPRDGTVFEVRFEYDKLFGQPMQFFVTAYREGSTWPEQFRFVEPGGERRHCREPAVDVSMRWWDLEPTLVPRLPLIGDTWAYRSIELDGSVYDPPGGLSIPQTFEVPSLGELISSSASIVLVEHALGQPPVVREAGGAPVLIELIARYEEPEPEEFTLFASSRTPEQDLVLQSDVLFNRHPIEEQVLIGLHEPSAPEKGVDLSRPLRERWQSGAEPRDLHETELFAALERSTGNDEISTSSGSGTQAGFAYLERARALIEGIPSEQRLATEPSPTVLAAWCTWTRATHDILDILKEESDVEIPLIGHTAVMLQELAEACECSEALRWKFEVLVRGVTAHLSRDNDETAEQLLVETVDVAERRFEAAPTLPSASEFVSHVTVLQQIAVASMMPDDAILTVGRAVGHACDELALLLEAAEIYGEDARCET